MVLNPKMGYKVQFRANSFNVGKVLENWQCQVTIGGDRKPKIAFNTNVTGEFITPSLTFGEPRLYFKYLWEKGVASMPITKTLSIANAGPLPTTVNLRIDPPFSCATERLTLTNGEPETISIDFDPGMKQDRLSDNISGKLTIAHANHPHRDVVQLQGEVCFPNLQILPPNIDFGCILNDTSKRKYLVLTNISEMPVSYEWSFLEEETNSLNAVQEEDETRKRRKKPKSLPVNEVFDILPVSGRLEPGQTENVEFTFQAGHGLLYNGIAVCSVDGGPDYEVPILGESSFVDFKLSTQELDYGEIPYNESSSKEFFIENIGKVPFEFSINLSTVSRPGIIECSQMSGKVIAGERFRVVIKFFPGVPDNIDEMLLVECGHFPAARFKVKAVGIYPGCLLSFPRASDEDYQTRLERAKSRLEQGQVTYAAPFSSSEAVRLMPALPAKMAEKEKAMIKDPQAMEIEVEADRELLCEKIVAKLG
jgi:hydrocephalus-inducing protein